MAETTHSIEDMLGATISYLFGIYDVRKGNENHIRMENVFATCMNDIHSHPCLIEQLLSHKEMVFFVTQTIMKMIPLDEVKHIIEPSKGV